jgi:hypothetical protein
MNYHKKGLKKLLPAILDNDVGRLVLTHKDRLLRFGAELVFGICEAKQVEAVILNQGKDTRQGGDARRHGRGGGQVLRKLQDLLLLRAQAGRITAFGTGMDMPTMRRAS